MILLRKNYNTGITNLYLYCSLIHRLTFKLYGNRAQPAHGLRIKPAAANTRKETQNKLENYTNNPLRLFSKGSLSVYCTKCVSSTHLLNELLSPCVCMWMNESVLMIDKKGPIKEETHLRHTECHAQPDH